MTPRVFRAPREALLPGAIGLNRSDGLQLGLALGSPGRLALRLRAIGLGARRRALALGGARSRSFFVANRLMNNSS